MDEKIEPIVNDMVKGLFSDGYSDVFGQILDAMGIDDDDTRDEVINDFQELVEDALAGRR